MLKMKKFVAVSIIAIMACSQTVFAAVPKLKGNTYNGMTASEIAKHYKPNGVDDNYDSYKITVPVEWDFQTTDIPNEIGVKKLVNTNVPEERVIEIYREVAEIIGRKELAQDAEWSYANYQFTTKYIKAGIYEATIYVDSRSKGKRIAIAFDIITNTGGNKEYKLPEEMKATPLSQITNRKEYTFPDMPRVSNSAVAHDVFYTEEKAAKIYELFEAGKISGSPDGYFNSKNAVTRAEFSTMLVSILGLQNKGNAESFSDATNHWAKSAIDTVVSNGLIKGVAPGKFDPNGRITHEQIAVICDRILEANDQPVTLTEGEWNAIKNHELLSYGKEAVAKCIKIGIFDDTDYWTPTNATTREDAVAIIYDLGQMLK